MQIVNSRDVFIASWFFAAIFASEIVWSGPMVHEHPFLLSPDESVIAVTTDPEVLRLLGVDGKKSINVPIPSPLLEFVFSPDGKKLAVVMENESLAIVDSATGKMNLIDDKGPCSGLAWSSDSLRLYYAIVDTRMVDDVPIKFFEIKKFETGLLTKKSIDAGKIKISKDRGSPVHPPDSSAQPLPREAPADKGKSAPRQPADPNKDPNNEGRNKKEETLPVDPEGTKAKSPVPARGQTMENFSPRPDAPQPSSQKPPQDAQEQRPSPPLPLKK